MVTGQAFEVKRRVYVDFEGISLRRKFLTGLEPESINMVIGKRQWVLSSVSCSGPPYNTIMMKEASLTLSASFSFSQARYRLKSLAYLQSCQPVKISCFL
jgi:hypothetical protein